MTFAQQVNDNPLRLVSIAMAVLLAVLAGFWAGQGPYFAVLGIALVVAATWLFLFLNSPMIGILLILLLRTTTERWNFPIVGPFTTNALLYVSVFAGGLMYCVLHRDKLHFNTGSRIYLLFVTYALISALIAPQRSTGFAAWVREASMFMLYFLFTQFGDQRSTQQRYLWFLGLIFGVHILIAFLQAIGLYPVPTNYDFSRRVAGGFGHANFFGYFLMLPLSLALGFLVTYKRARVVLLCLVVCGAGLAALVATMTRGAWIVAALMWLIFGIVGRKWLLPLGAAAALAIYAVSPQVQDRLYWLIEQPNWNAATSGRVAIWSDNLPMIMKSPFWGHGLESHKFYSSIGADAHNGYLKLIFETGAIGLVIYLIFALINIYYGFRAWRRSSDPFDRALALGIFVFLITFLVGGAWENLFLGQGSQWFGFSAAGLVAGIMHQVRTKQDQENSQFPIVTPSPA